MNPSTIDDQAEVTRYKGVNNSSGKIVKGTLNDAPIKVKVSSIPSKFQNVVFRNDLQPAFGDSKQRFFQLSAKTNNVPGPGIYTAEKKSSKIFSKKGLGSFASSTKLQRLQRSRTHNPGPGTYATASSKSSKKQRLKNSNFHSLDQSASTALLSSQIQSRDIFKNEVEKAMKIPGPCEYAKEFQENIRNKSTYSNFKSKINRFAGSSEITPGVGSYNPHLTRKPQTIRYEKPEVQKKQTLVQQKQKIQKMLFNKQSEKNRLGPGAYNPTPQKSQKVFKIKDNMYDRFGNLKSLYVMAQNPNINEEHHQETEPRLKHSKTTHMFASNTQRPDFFVNKNQLGPARYRNTTSSIKKSHLINFSNKWVGS